MMMKTICPFFGKCGGCLYQDLPEEEYLEKKKNFIKRAFADYGMAVEPDDVRSVPLHSRRRASFSFAGGILGYNALKSHQIIEITNCLLLKHEIIQFLPVLRQNIKKLGGAGDVFVLVTGFGLDIHIKTDKMNIPALAQLELLTALATHPAVVRLTYNTEPVAQKVRLPLMPDDFLQPSQEGEKIISGLILDEIAGVRRAVDLFCGSGTFTRPLLDRGICVSGYDCARTVTLLGPKGVSRDLFRNPLLPDELNGLDLIILDPPRAGAKAQVEQIAQTDVPKIVMVSCAPQTAARDSKILIDSGWKLKKLIPVDQFTWSNHIELVAIFEKK
ncbi:MAG: class I SAM-dependent RNA methyltransferase [Alphaproteobacteria bacterium]|nr:class I SAM-dependent RNA methyltransferase [Alphaproteobacteria bacterium]